MRVDGAGVATLARFKNENARLKSALTIFTCTFARLGSRKKESGGRIGSRRVCLVWARNSGMVSGIIMRVGGKEGRRESLNGFVIQAVFPELREM